MYSAWYNIILSEDWCNSRSERPSDKFVLNVFTDTALERSKEERVRKSKTTDEPTERLLWESDGKLWRVHHWWRDCDARQDEMMMIGGCGCASVWARETTWCDFMAPKYKIDRHQLFEVNTIPTLINFMCMFRWHLLSELIRQRNTYCIS